MASVASGRSPPSSAATASPPPRATPPASTTSSQKYGDALLPIALDVTDRAADFAAVAAGARPLRPARHRRQQRRLRPLRDDRGDHRGRGASPARDQPVRRAVGHPGRPALPARAGQRPHHPGLVDRRHLGLPAGRHLPRVEVGRSRASARRWRRRWPASASTSRWSSPAAFSTDWAGSSSKRSAEHPAYADVHRSHAGDRAKRAGNPGDPEATRRGDPARGRRRGAAAARVLRRGPAGDRHRRLRAAARAPGTSGSPSP